MMSNPNDERGSPRSKRRVTAGSADGGNMEFNFEKGPPTMHESRISPKPETEPFSRKVEPSASPADEAAHLHDDRSFRPKNAGPGTGPKPVNNPIFSQAQQNIQRQAREQRAVGQILSGAALVFIGLILLVGGLAGYGGWLLYNQIVDQTVHVVHLDAKFSQDVFDLKRGLQATATTVDNLTNQTRAQKEQIGWLQNQLEDVRNQIKKDRAALETRIKRLENRVYDLERIEAERR